ncbi:DUF4339 domain-containing protein [Roseimaritima ulvae]|uniref:GYF domain-containing protein n=1 Tax=Roseimaritima ulvae TaxID=980254 RepID=A0A5B9R0N0_9BACT|nr:DUF4339 domain-containing protein [Roseimaritima ulvae]QEG39823.1 hypothetical protein UC8_18220 [Roseimaritima ulvae]
MSEWFIRQEDVEIGPVDGRSLLDMIRGGSVTTDTLVRKNDSAWFQAGAVGGLFEAAAESTTEYFCPDCSSKVVKPPCICPHCGIQLSYARAKVSEHKIQGFQPKPKPKRSNSVQKWLQRVQTPRQK